MSVKVYFFLDIIKTVEILQDVRSGFLMGKHCSLVEIYLKFTHLIGPGLKSPEQNTLQYLEEVAVQTAKYVMTALSFKSENNLIVFCMKVNGSVNLIPVLIVASSFGILIIVKILFCVSVL